MNKFIFETYRYVFMSLLLATLGAFVGLQSINLFTSTPVFIGLVIVELLVLFAFLFFYKKPIVNILLYMTFSILTGLTMVPLLFKVISIDPSLVVTAFLLTAIAVGSFSLYAIKTDRDFSGMGKYLFIGLIVLIVGLVLNLFLQIPMLHLALTIASVILFSFYLIYDTQAIIRGEYETPMIAAMSLYIDILNIFQGILSLLLQVAEDD